MIKMNNKEIIFNILKWEKNSIPYRPEVAKEIWVIPAIILQQMIYRWNWEKFYKFIEPSKNEKYREWDSWTEELWLTKFEFTNNLKKIAFKLGKNKNEIKKEDALIIYYTDSNRLTWYDINLDNISKLLNKCYSANYLVSKETWFTKENKESKFTKEKEETWFTNHIQKNTTKNTTNNIYKGIDFEKLKEEYNFLNHKDIEDLFLEYLEIRKKLKAPNTERAIKLLLKKLYWKWKLEIKKMIENAILNWRKSFYLLKKEFVDFKEKNKKQNELVSKQIKENEKYKNSWASQFWKVIAWQKAVSNEYIDYNKHNDNYYRWLEILWDKNPPF